MTNEEIMKACEGTCFYDIFCSEPKPEPTKAVAIYSHYVNNESVDFTHEFAITANGRSVPAIRKEAEAIAWDWMENNCADELKNSRICFRRVELM